MDPFDVTETVSLIDQGKTVTLIVGEEVVELEFKTVQYVRLWFDGWVDNYDHKKEISEDDRKALQPKKGTTD